MDFGGIAARPKCVNCKLTLPRVLSVVLEVIQPAAEKGNGQIELYMKCALVMASFDGSETCCLENGSLRVYNIIRQLRSWSESLQSMLLSTFPDNKKLEKWRPTFDRLKVMQSYLENGIRQWTIYNEIDLLLADENCKIRKTLLDELFPSLLFNKEDETQRLAYERILTESIRGEESDKERLLEELKPKVPWDNVIQVLKGFCKGVLLYESTWRQYLTSLSFDMERQGKILGCPPCRDDTAKTIALQMVGLD
jgi:hypothetical protein